MDPFSGEGELLNIVTAFHTHAYQTVLDFDVSTLSSSNKATAQVLKYRSQIALGQSSNVINTLRSNKDAASKSLVALAQHQAGNASGLNTANELSSSPTDSEDSTVQICAGTVLASAGSYAEAISLLQKHQGNLEAVMLLTQIHLTQNRTDLALKEIAAAKRWAQDSLLINLAEAWVNLRVGGTEKYQSAYYVYEELATAPGTTSPSALVGQAVAELQLGRTEEADAALKQAMEMGNVDVQAVANALVLTCVTGKKGGETAALMERLVGMQADHPLVVDLEEKSALFDSAAAKYSAKVAQ